ncbi:MAG TPA: hypothetical protein PK920_04730 [Phycisphaerae bacterium]|nr:hypothetical protein [Phycisphaerae bacterium]HRS28388.1 hypothetical protein [Phycisphaerae bacterium]
MSTNRYQKLSNRKRRIQYRLRERTWAPQDQPMFRGMKTGTGMKTCENVDDV